MRFCEWLKSVKEQLNTTCLGISVLCDVPESTVSSHVRGDKFPGKRNFVKYFEAFGVPYFWPDGIVAKKIAFAYAYQHFLNIELQTKEIEKQGEDY